MLLNAYLLEFSSFAYFLLVKLTMPRGVAKGSILGSEEKPRKNVERKATFLSFFKVERRGIKINKTNNGNLKF